MTLNLEQLREVVSGIAHSDSAGEMRGKAMRLSEWANKLSAESYLNMLNGCREYDAEHFPNAPEGDYIVRTKYANEWLEATYTEYYDMGGSSEKNVYHSLQMFTKSEALEIFARKDPLDRGVAAWGPIAKVPRDSYLTERP